VTQPWPYVRRPVEPKAIPWPSKRLAHPRGAARGRPIAAANLGRTTCSDSAPRPDCRSYQSRFAQPFRIASRANLRANREARASPAPQWRERQSAERPANSQGGWLSRQYRRGLLICCQQSERPRQCSGSLFFNQMNAAPTHQRASNRLSASVVAWLLDRGWFAGEQFEQGLTPLGWSAAAGGGGPFFQNGGGSLRADDLPGTAVIGRSPV
jgi:hypothetical protein